MDKRSETSEEECVVETRQNACLVKFEKIVNQFEELMETVDSVTQSRKRRKASNPQRKKSAAGAAAINSATSTGQMNSQQTEEVGEGDSSAMSSASQAEKTAALEQIIAKHLSELQSDQPLDVDSNK